MLWQVKPELGALIHQWITPYFSEKARISLLCQRVDNG